MTILRLLVSLFVLASSGATMAAQESLSAQAAELATQKQDLALRALVRYKVPKRLSRKEWLAVRSTLHSRPGVGHDMLTHWDRIAPDRWLTKSKQKLTSDITTARELLVEKKFMDSAKAFRQIAEGFDVEKLKVGHPNFFLYQDLLHSMARALFGAKRFEDALKVYSWISVLYPFYRQVQFEKMWTAFKAGRSELALGAITSQRSVYFSTYLQPESYLIQYYLYHQLCRHDELVFIQKEVARFQADIDSGAFNVEKWVRNDVETLALWVLLGQKDIAIRALGDKALVDAEIEWIHRNLKRRFDHELPRLKAYLARVKSYITVAGQRKSASLPAIAEIPGLKKLLSSEDEMWPVDTGEDWLDELGRHLFIGKSKCQKGDS